MCVLPTALFQCFVALWYCGPKRSTTSVLFNSCTSPTLNMQNEYKFLSSTFLRSLYNEPLTPSSNPSLSPGGSPLREGPLERSTLPSPADWSEFINASNSKVERDLAQLTLSDPEQRELYEAARLVQTAFRKYKVQARRSGAICCVYCSPQ